jgi:hypothetical protein
LKTEATIRHALAAKTSELQMQLADATASMSQAASRESDEFAALSRRVSAIEEGQTRILGELQGLRAAVEGVEVRQDDSSASSRAVQRHESMLGMMQEEMRDLKGRFVEALRLINNGQQPLQAFNAHTHSHAHSQPHPPPPSSSSSSFIAPRHASSFSSSSSFSHAHTAHTAHSNHSINKSVRFTDERKDSPTKRMADAEEEKFIQSLFAMKL